jgi:hypothetical protein
MRRVGWIAAVVGLAVGCGRPDPRSRAFEVSGTVTFDGEPVPDGAITLFPDDPTLPADAGTITDGRYKFLASAGKKRVQIRASREVPQAVPANVPRDPRFEEYIPAQFNDRSDLSIEVVPDGTNTFDFTLKSK